MGLLGFNQMLPYTLGNVLGTWEAVISSLKVTTPGAYHKSKGEIRPALYVCWRTIIEWAKGKHDPEKVRVCSLYGS